METTAAAPAAPDSSVLGGSIRPASAAKAANAASVVAGPSDKLSEADGWLDWVLETVSGCALAEAVVVTEIKKKSHIYTEQLENNLF